MFKFKSVLLVGVVIAVAVFAAACAAPAPQPTGAPVVQTVAVPQTVVVEVTPTSGAQATSAPQGSAITINGAGATFPYPLYSRWFYEYAFVDPSVKFNYQAIGSGGGIAQITAKTVDFGASDAILTDAQLQAAQGVQMFPAVAGGIVPSYNLTGDDGKVITATIKFPSTSLADIYLGKIKKWNDPVLATANPDLKLPAKDILLVHRSDGSGTTFAFTDYLSKVSPDWKSQVGSATSVKWPSGLGGKGNDGVSGVVAQNDGSLGYVELAYAIQNKLAYGSVQNAAGNYPVASLASVQSAMADFGTNMGDKLALSIANAPGKDSWPISTYTYLLLYMNQTDCAKAQKVISFVKWAYGDGSKFATDLLYVTLPDAVKTQVLTKLGQITCNGKPL
jgi:phosphate transport system substrate-binding protein